MSSKFESREILFCAPLPPPTTGQSVACELLIKSLMEDSKVHVVNLSKSTFRQGADSPARIADVLLIIKEIFEKRNTYRVFYLNISESVMGNLKDLVIYFVCWRRLDRMVIHLHGGAGMKVLIGCKHPLLRILNSLFLKRLGAVIVLGDRLKSIYEGIVPPAKLYAVANFAKDELFVTPCYIVKKYIDVEPLRLLFLSNHLPGKGYVELLASLVLLSPESRQRLHVDFAGGFETIQDEARFRKQVHEITYVHVEVHGVVHGVQKMDLLNKAHLFCLPTYYPYEGQPISILEAYASGCAVMTTDHSGIFDTFTPGVNGLEVMPRSPESIARAIEQALGNIQVLCRYALNNLEQAQQKYRASTHIEAIEKIIFSVC